MLEQLKGHEAILYLAISNLLIQLEDLLEDDSLQEEDINLTQGLINEALLLEDILAKLILEEKDLPISRPKWGK